MTVVTERGGQALKFRRSEKYASIAFYTVITMLAAAVIALVFFKFDVIKGVFSSVMGALAPVTYGFVIAYLSNPLMKFFENKVFRFKKAKKDRAKLRRALSIAVSLLIIFAVVAAFFVLLIPQISDSYTMLTEKMDGYLKSTQSFVDSAMTGVRDFFKEHESLGKLIDVDKLSDQLKSFLSNISGYIGSIANVIISSLTSIINELKNLIIGIFLSIYMLYHKEKLCAQIKKLLSAVTSRKVYLNIVSLTRFTDRAFGGFITGKILDSVIIGLVCFIVFAILGFNYYPLMALVVAVTNIIPIFGPFIGAGIIGVLVLIAQPSKLLLFLIVDLIIQQVDGNIVGPKILGGTIGMSGMWVMISITFAGALFGLPGMLLGVPAFAVIYSLLREFSESRLKKKSAPHVTASYLEDPPEKDYLHARIFLHRDEDIPEGMEYPPEVEVKPEEPKKSLWQKVEEKAVSKAKSKKKK